MNIRKIMVQILNALLKIKETWPARTGAVLVIVGGVVFHFSIQSVKYDVGTPPLLAWLALIPMLVGFFLVVGSDKSSEAN